jgi:glycosyltransferase involved in cell wall biosynthesis
MRSLSIAVYHNLHSGGAKRVAAGHLRDLSRRHVVTLYSLADADHAFAAAPDTDYAVRLYDCPRYRMLRSPFGRLNPLLRVANARRLDRLNRKIARDIDAAGHDVVVVHPCQVTGAPPLLKWLRMPSVYYLHEWPRKLYEPPIERPYQAEAVSSGRARLRAALDRLDPLRPLTALFFRRIDRASVRAATRRVTNSQFTLHTAQPVYRTPIEVCYLGVDVGAVPAADAGPGRERVVLSVGSLTPAKGFDFVIRALSTIASGTAGGPPPLVIISNFQEREERAYLTSLAAAGGVPLTLLEGVTDADLSRWYRRVACVAYAPVREPFGLVALEAMAAGAPVVAVAEGGVSESVIDGQTGLIARRDPAEFGEAVRRLLDDPLRAQRLAESARAHVARMWTWERHLERFEAVLMDVVGAAA